MNRGIVSEKIKRIKLTYLDIPFTPHSGKHLQYWIPDWRISQICKITLDSGQLGWGETIPNYTWCRVPDNIAERVVGRHPAEVMWDDSLGAGVQLALFDVVGKTEKGPVYRLLNTKVRDWCPISWVPMTSGRTRSRTSPRFPGSALPLRRFAVISLKRLTMIRGP